MTTPFPGMDPFLEGSLWPDVHLGLSFLIKEQIAPLVGMNYVVRTATYMVEDVSPENDIGIMYPDVEVLRRTGQTTAAEMDNEYETISQATLTAPTISLDLAFPLEVRIPVVEIRDRQSNQLITAIEILSPVNKRTPGLEPYRKKRLRLYEGGVHLLEIDLIRRGERPFQHVLLPKSHYLALLTRAESSKTQAWAFQLQDPLPVLPVPLRGPDPDVPLVLGQALDDLYTRSLYQLSINYRDNPPPPSLSAEEQAWMRQLLDVRPV